MRIDLGNRAVQAPPITAPRVATNATPGPSPERYDYDLRLDPKKGQLDGTGSIEIRNTSSEPLTELYLRLWPNAKGSADEGGTANVSAVTVNGKSVAARVNGTVAHVLLDQPLAAGASARLAFATSISIPKIESRFGRPDSNTVRIGNALPTLVVKDAEGWNLDPYVSNGESFYNLTSNWYVNLALPTGWDVLSTGSVVRSDAAQGVQHLSIDAPKVRDFAIAALRGYRMLETTVDGTKVRVAADKDVNDTRARSLLAATADSVKYFNQRFGPYGYPELDVVAAHSWGDDGMEYPGLVIDGAGPSERGWSENIETAAHEAAHQWFYGIVGNNQFDASWLDESLTQYAAYEFMRTQRPGDADPDVYKPRPTPYRISAPRADAFNDRSDDYFNALYGNGPIMLDELRTELGEQRFDDALRDWVADNRHGIVTGEQFITHMSTAAGRDLTGWFQKRGVLAHEPGTLTKLDPNAKHKG